MLKQRIRRLIDERGITRYRFWKDLGVAQNTAYKLYDDETAVPREDVMERLFQVYGWQPGDYLYAISAAETEESSEPTSTEPDERSPSPLQCYLTKTPRNQQFL